MKVLLTILEREDAIKVDLPILPEYNSKIYLSPGDYDKLLKSMKDMPIPHQDDMLKISKKDKEAAAILMLENSTVQVIDIAWDEEENAYLPLVCLSLGDEFFGDNVDDDDDLSDEHDIDGDIDFEKLFKTSEKKDKAKSPKQKKEKKKDLFN